jgi:hypothetical protein
MSDDFLPEFKVMQAKCGGYRGMYRLFCGKEFKLIPGAAKATASQAMSDVKEYVRLKLNPPIRAEKKAPEPDTLGRAQWHEQRAAVEAERQERVLGAVIIRGKPVAIERRRVRA